MTRRAWVIAGIAGAALVVAVALAIPAVTRHAGASGEKDTINIGVLLNLTGARARGAETVLDAVAAEINGSGGVNGRQVRLVYRDTNAGDVGALARDLAEDPEIDSVIGPQSSADCLLAAPHFIKNKKLLISPTATSVDLFKMFGKRNYFWRTCQSDIAQAKVIVDILASRETEKIGLLTVDNKYGASFRDWVPFFALEAGITLENVVSYSPDGSDRTAALSRMIEGDPDYVIVAGYAQDAVAFKRQLGSSGSSARLFLTDGAQTEHLITSLGADAEGLEGTSPTSDPTKKFDAMYADALRARPNDFASHTLDAFLLCVYVAARQEAVGGEEDCAESLRAVVAGHEPSAPWNRADLHIAEILKGGAPEIDGASGALEFDTEFGVDPLATYYAHWSVEKGAFTTVSKIDPRANALGRLNDDASMARTRGSDMLSESPVGGSTTLPARSGVRVVIVATSTGWENYRHQSDALNLYQLVRRNGVPDEDILLFIADDIAQDDRNPAKGVVASRASGRDLRAGASIDGSASAVAFDNVRNALMGRATKANRAVLKSDRGSDVLLYFVGHGTDGSLVFDSGADMSAAEFKALVSAMSAQHRFRRLLVVVESCFSGSLVDDIDVPNALFITSASRSEQSHGTNYDMESDVWHADEFSDLLVGAIEKDSRASLLDTYTKVYSEVAGSHPRMHNQATFGDIRDTTIGDFVAP